VKDDAKKMTVKRELSGNYRAAGNARERVTEESAQRFEIAAIL